jgi:glycosyltransferase involved in cell wall biosynthesis
MRASAGSRSRRTLIIVENLPVPFDRRVWQESCTLRDAGYEVTVICPTGKGFNQRSEIIDDIQVLRYKLPLEAGGIGGYFIEYPYSLLMQFWLAVKVYLTRGFDVIHACNPPDLIFLVALPFKLLGVRFLFDHHDINPELYEAKFGRKGLLYRVSLLFERLSFWFADASLATNESYRAIAISRGRMPPDRVTVVRSGPDLRRLSIAPPVPELRNGRTYLVGYVGVMGKQEGLDLLLDSVGHIVHQKGRRDVQFILVGGGTELSQLQELARELDIEPYVTFTGRVSDEDLLNALSTADVCVNPDRANEMNDKSTMNKIMEYMSLAKPIVQFDLTEGRFSAQAASLYAEPNNSTDFAEKILILLDDPSMRERMGAAGRSRVVNDLAWEYEAPKLLAAYDKLFT